LRVRKRGKLLKALTIYSTVTPGVAGSSLILSALLFSLRYVVIAHYQNNLTIDSYWLVGRSGAPDKTIIRGVMQSAGKGAIPGVAIGICNATE
jgi:hypothetical protein